MVHRGKLFSQHSILSPNPSSWRTSKWTVCWLTSLWNQRRKSNLKRCFWSKSQRINYSSKHLLDSRNSLINYLKLQLTACPNLDRAGSQPRRSLKSLRSLNQLKTPSDLPSKPQKTYQSLHIQGKSCLQSLKLKGLFQLLNLNQTPLPAI